MWDAVGPFSNAKMVKGSPVTELGLNGGLIFKHRSRIWMWLLDLIPFPAISI